MFDSYIWDFDGTLFDTYPIMLDSMMKALEDRQVAADPKAVYRLLKEKSSKALTEKYHLDFQEFSDDFHQYETLDTRQPITFDHVYDTLAQLKQQGSKHYILTHRTIASTRELLVKEGMLEFFEEIVGPESQFPRKPDPSSLNYLVEKYQMDPQRTVMVGDRVLDIEAGKNAGVKTCFYDIDHFLENVPADYTIHSMEEILSID